AAPAVRDDAVYIPTSPNPVPALAHFCQVQVGHSSLAPKLTLQHVSYGDAWQVDPALIRGLRRADVERMVEQHRRLQSIFSATFQ
ncbi:MAG: hypothetical protein ACYCPO_11885, partial [Acidobacteriaceae bacterium]